MSKCGEEAADSEDKVEKRKT